MTINIYDLARIRFATKGLHWINDGVKVSIPPVNYNPLYNEHRVIGDVGTLRGTSTVASKAIDARGWFQCDPLFFESIPLNQPITQVVIYRSIDGILMFRIGFPSVSSSVPKPLIILPSLNSDGLCKL